MSLMQEKRWHDIEFNKINNLSLQIASTSSAQCQTFFKNVALHNMGWVYVAPHNGSVKDAQLLQHYCILYSRSFDAHQWVQMI